MRLETLPSEFQEALPVLEKIKRLALKLILLGALFEMPFCSDLFTMWISLAPAILRKPSVSLTGQLMGIEHGTVLVLENNREYEVTTSRTEDVYVDYRRPARFLCALVGRRSQAARFHHQCSSIGWKRARLLIFSKGLDDSGKSDFAGSWNCRRAVLMKMLSVSAGFSLRAALDFDLEQDTFVAMKDCAPLLEKKFSWTNFIEFV